MSTFGRQQIATVGKSIRLSADGCPMAKQAGVTIDWSLIVAVSGSDVTLADGVTVYIGEKYLRYGQVICAVTTAEVQTVDLSGADDPNGGTWSLTILGTTITGIVWNVTAAALQAAIVAALTSVDGAEEITVSKTGFVYTITFPAFLGNVAAVTADGTSLTTAASTITITITTSTSGVSNSGKYGPYDPAATDGRQTLTRGQCFLLNQTMKENDLHSDHPEAIYGGKVFKDRIIQSGVAAHTLALGPTLAEVTAAFPQLQYVVETPH